MNSVVSIFTVILDKKIAIGLEQADKLDIVDSAKMVVLQTL